MKPYVIMSPDYNITSGGIKVMWGLFGWLLSKGLEVYMNRYPHGNVVAVYPEIFHGNPVGANTVVRYILNKPGVMGAMDAYGGFKSGPLEFDPMDKLYYFSRLFGKAENENHYMFLPIINMNTFRVTNYQKRDKTCFIVGKGVNKNLHPKDAIELNRALAQDQGELVDILNQCHTLYCYDELSAIMECARLCGCSVSYHGGTYSMEQLALYEPGTNGINGQLDAEKFRYDYLELIRLFELKLELFIEETQK